MTEKGKLRNKGKVKKIVILKCDICGKESRIKEINLYQKEIDAARSNNGCYCSKCSLNNKRSGFSYTIHAGDLYHIYPKIIPLKEYQEMQESVNRAKEILKRGLAQEAHKHNMEIISKEKVTIQSRDEKG